MSWPLKEVPFGAARLHRQLDNLLTLSRARKIVPPTVSIPAKKIIQASLSALEYKIKSTQAVIQVADVFPDLRVDPVWAEAALTNLIGNALKFVKEGEAPQIEISPCRFKAAGVTEEGFLVQDRGPGVPPEMAERIFVLFQRAVGRNVEGTGAGLAIVKAVAERHGGRAWVEPREGGGSKFFIVFEA